MSTHLNLSLPNLFFLSVLLLSLTGTTRSDDTCPYPCYPPPTGTVPTPTTPSVTTIPPPPPPSQSVSSYPPPIGTGYQPYIPPPPYGGDGGGFSGSPPPPDPILPYFPFYYRKPPHETDVSSATGVGKWSLLTLTNVFGTFVLPILMLCVD